MKKVLLALVLVCLVLPVFADDALVLPEGVLRITIAPSYSFGDKVWDSSGDSQDIATPSGAKSDGIKFLNLAMAFEYGVNDWITGAFQWTPGINLYSDLGFDKQATPYPGVYRRWDNAEMGRFFDLFFGAKVQVIGKKAPVQRDDMRLSFAAGVKVPIPGGSYSDVTSKITTNDSFVLSEPDRHLWGLGLRAYYDYLFTESFFVNLYSEFIYYPEQKLKDGVNFGVDDKKIAFGYDLKFEVEPTYTMPIGNGVNLKLSLPFTYAMTPDAEVDGSKYISSTTTKYAPASYMLSTSPTVGCFFTKTFMPFELLLKYKVPLVGENQKIIQNVALIGKFYLKF